MNIYQNIIASEITENVLTKFKSTVTFPVTYYSDSQNCPLASCIFSMAKWLVKRILLYRDHLKLLQLAITKMCEFRKQLNERDLAFRALHGTKREVKKNRMRIIMRSVSNSK